MAVNWNRVSPSFTLRRVFLEICGDTSTGRTTLALTAPGPIALLHFGEKIEGIANTFATNKEIRELSFSPFYPPGLSDKEVANIAAESWKQFEAAWYDAFHWARTIIMDTHTDAWEAIRFAYFGDVKPDGGRMELNWGPVNGRWSSLLKMVRSPEVQSNVILIGATEDEYKETINQKTGLPGQGKKTGVTVRKGQKSIPRICDVSIRTRKGPQGFSSYLEKAWMSGGLEYDRSGIEFSNELSTFANWMGMITNTPPSEWEK
jgi:hypothetical protein